MSGNTIDGTLAGRIATEPKVKVSDSGRARLGFRLAVDDRERNQAGEWYTRQTVFHTATKWFRTEDQANRVARQLAVGDAVVVTGAMRFSAYEDREGNARQGSEFVVEKIGHDLDLSTVSVDRAGRGPARTAGRAPAPGVDPAGPDVADGRGASPSR